MPYRVNYMDEAESCYAIAIATGPLETHVLHERTLGLARADRRDAALECYDELIRRDPDDLVAVRRLATLLWSWGHSDEALSLAGRLVEDPAPPWSATPCGAQSSTRPHGRSPRSKTTAASWSSTQDCASCPCRRLCSGES